ncbi:Serine carboxypeptidases (lysosomal cathepsin A) [Handroanthus impetiginosus]|uniref:Serine carboxypeptidases (Lysosomal cathepsin A) n=1 Tax=Handroanthus impetiginosus TaxID=429701 RepID=A0A2G9IA20_9LAMI|nr:Serine carboxypeptidases (lysosomal cathepsin A) [Handroanthus impetiginosus]
MKSCKHLLLFFLLLIKTTTSQSIITTLPGFPGPLPFKLETGYISVGEHDEKQLFYYFIESERNTETDPLLFWLNGGPGCSGFSGLAFEIGPLAFDLATFDGSFPSLIINPYSWTKIASIIFIDAPVGTGFSYFTTSEGYLISDTKSASDSYLFLRKWLLKHPKFLKNHLYVTGDSYGGKMIPMIASEVAKGNEAGLQPRMLLQGYTIGNPVTNEKMDINERIPYFHRMALISDEYFELAKSNCNGDYVNPDPNNHKCLYALQLVRKCTEGLYESHILEPKCEFMSPKPNDFLSGQLFVEEDPVDVLFLSKQERPWCRNYNYMPAYIWANNETVQEALHIRKGTVTDWQRCNTIIARTTLFYEKDVESVFEHHHQLLNEKGFRALVYSGDHDMSIPYMSTLKWMRNLNLIVDEGWRPWYVDGQIAGYTEKYKNINQAYITFSTVKGGGHTAPEYKPKECLAMIERWLSLVPL